MLHQAQKEIVNDLHRFRILVCGRKFGKTTLAAEEIAGKVISKSGQRVLYLSPTLDDSRRLMWDRLKKKLAGATIKTNDTRLEIKVRTIDGGESDVFLGSWEKVQDYRGDEFDFIVPDEVQDYREFWVGWHEALRPTLTPRKGSALFMGTPKGFNHFYDLFYTEDADYQGFKFTSYDNPFIPKEEIDKARSELTEDRFSQEYLADFRKTQGLVYKEFNRGLHLFGDDKQPTGTLISGIDFGFTHPAAVLSIIKDDDARYWVTTEWYKTGRTEAQIADYVQSCQFTKVYPDPENPSAIEVLNQRGINVSEVTKGKDSVQSGINKVRDLLKANRLFIHKDCLNLIAEFETYSYADGNKNENPLKENDDALDALRYAMMMDALLTDPESDREQLNRIHANRAARQTNELLG